MSVDLSLVEAAHDNNQTKITNLISSIVSKQSTNQSSKQSSPALARDVGGRSALHYAAINGNLELAQFVINQYNASSSDQTADQNVDIINALDGQGQSALHLALANDHLHIAELLLQQSVKQSIQSVDSFGRLPLHWAIRQGYVNLIDKLVDNIDVNQQTQSGETPLYWAVEHSIDPKVNQTNCEQIIRKLLDHGANPSLKNNRDDTPLTLAEKSSDTIREMINQSIKESNSPATSSRSMGIDLTSKSSVSNKPPAKKLKITMKPKT